jgi:adenosine/AMP kinase
MVHIGSAGNTWYPSLIIILNNGYELEIIESDINNPESMTLFVAKKNDVKFVSHNFLSLLGLISIWDYLGDSMLDRVNDAEQILSETVSYYDLDE